VVKIIHLKIRGLQKNELNYRPLLFTGILAVVITTAGVVLIHRRIEQRIEQRIESLRGL
jgi:hypothetical protein